MTYRADDQIRRLADGSIDYRHYYLRARRIRSSEFRGIVGLLRALDPRKR